MDLFVSFCVVDPDPEFFGNDYKLFQIYNHLHKSDPIIT